MSILLLFAATMLLGALLSARAKRGVLSTAALFLLVGFVAGPGVTGVIGLNPRDAINERVTEIALVTVLFADGMKPDLGRLRRNWGLPARALILGLPITMALIAALAIVVLGVPPIQALLLGAILSPTDPVFASAIVSRGEIPFRVRQLLNIESGLNDGLALPAVVLLLALLGGRAEDPVGLLGEVALGVAIGFLVPAVAIRLDRLSVLGVLGVHEGQRSLHVIAIGLLVYALAVTTGGNVFLAAFTAGLTVSWMAGSFAKAFEPVGEAASETMKLAALLLFGALLAPRTVVAEGIGAFVFAALVLLVARPVAMGIVLAGTRLTLRERLVAAWFGPRGFASLFYVLLVLSAGIDGAPKLFHVVAVVVAVSVVAHTMTEVPAVRWYERHRRRGKEAKEAQEAQGAQGAGAG